MVYAELVLTPCVLTFRIDNRAFSIYYSTSPVQHSSTVTVLYCANYVFKGFVFFLTQKYGIVPTVQYLETGQ